MTGSKRVVALVAMAVLAFASEARANAYPRPVEETLAYQLLEAERAERTDRTVPQAKFDLLRSVLRGAMDAGRAQHRWPRSRREVIDVFDAIQIALAEHNFVHPISQDTREYTIGDALEPQRLSREERARLLAPGSVNGFRARYIDPTKPLYFADSAIGSLLFISVGQRMGWDIRLVTVPGHSFVRWYGRSFDPVNWDWTAGSPSSDDYYSTQTGRLYRDWRERRRYRYLAGLSLGYARANYLFQMARQVAGTGPKRRLLERAMRAEPTHEQVQNSLAWLYATDPALATRYSRQAVAYALSVWAAMPDDPSTADTVACAYAARGERSLAVQIERYAIERLEREGRTRAIRDYERRLRQIQSGDTCSAD
jgi:hypothetical protein